jgi:hypothetical protein
VMASHLHEDPDADYDFDDEDDENDSGYEEEEEDDDDDLEEDNQDNQAMNIGSYYHYLKPVNTSHHTPEHIVLPMPSLLRLQPQQEPIIAGLAEDELLIRQSQASDAIEQLRLALGMKSAIFRKMVSSAKSQKKKTRAWHAVSMANSAVQRHARAYSLARYALVELHAEESILTRFPPLQKGDLSVSKDIVEENRVGQRSEHVSWIWRHDIGVTENEDDWMNESK